jgi:uncharacterized membrane protein
MTLPDLSRLLQRLPRINPRIAAIAVIALSILHIVVTLATPSITATTAYARLQSMPLNAMQILAAPGPESQILPFLGADARYAICRFDTTRSPVALKASLPGKGWTLALYSHEGDNFYVASGSEGKRTDLSINLVSSDERFTGVSPEARGLAGDSQTTVPVASRRGIAVVRAPDRGLAYQGRDESELRRAACSATR